MLVDPAGGVQVRVPAAQPFHRRLPQVAGAGRVLRPRLPLRPEGRWGRGGGRGHRGGHGRGELPRYRWHLRCILLKTLRTGLRALRSLCKPQATFANQRERLSCASIPRFLVGDDMIVTTLAAGFLAAAARRPRGLPRPLLRPPHHRRSPGPLRLRPRKPPRLGSGLHYSKSASGIVADRAGASSP